MAPSTTAVALKSGTGLPIWALPEAISFWNIKQCKGLGRQPSWASFNQEVCYWVHIPGEAFSYLLKDCKQGSSVLAYNSSPTSSPTFVVPKQLRCTSEETISLFQFCIALYRAPVTWVVKDYNCGGWLKAIPEECKIRESCTLIPLRKTAEGLSQWLLGSAGYFISLIPF